MPAAAPPAPDIKSFAPVDVLGAIDLPPVPGNPAPAPAPAPPPARVDPPVVEDLEDLDVQDEGPASIKDFKPNDTENPAPAPQPDTEPKPSGPKELRARLKQVDAEREAALAKLAEKEKEIQEERAKPRPDAAELESLRNELALLKAKEVKTAEEHRRASAKDHPEVLAIKQPFLEKVDDFSNVLAMDKGARVGKEFDSELSDLVNDRLELGNRDSAGFDERQTALMEKIEKYGPEHKATILNLLTEGARTLMKASDKQKEVAENETEYVLKDRVTRYGKAVQEYESIAGNYGRVDENLISADPLKPSHIIHNLVSNSDGGKTAAAQVKNLIRLAMVPPPPVDPRQEAVMGTEAFRTMIDAGLGQHNQAKKIVTAAMYDGLMAMRLLPSLQKRVLELEAEKSARHREAPSVNPLPVNPTPAAPEGPADPRKFTPENIAI